MGDANFLFYNGQLQKTGKLLISPDNRSFRYGDGFFETMKLVNGKILLQDFHFERLFASLDLLKFQKPVYFTPAYLAEQVAVLAKKNFHHKLARIRLTVFRGEGGLYEVENHFPHHLIQSWELNTANNRFNENGLVTDIFRDARKVSDRYSAVKSNNYLSYVMAALWARENKLNDALLLNSEGRLADATIANVFLVKDGIIKTPALTEGCVNGVMRRYLLQAIRTANMPVEETEITEDELNNATEVFLTNAIYGVRWIKEMGRNGYTSQLASFLYKNFVSGLNG